MVDGPEPIISYRTGWVVYEESLTKGQFVGRGWNGAGYINFYDGRLDPAEFRLGPAQGRHDVGAAALAAQPAQLAAELSAQGCRGGSGHAPYRTTPTDVISCN